VRLSTVPLTVIPLSVYALVGRIPSYKILAIQQKVCSVSTLEESVWSFLSNLLHMN
ncbi:hypothetical protein PHET_06794, partial [Paragonimus heterotremus]